MKPNNPLAGIAAQPVVTFGALGIVGVPHTAGLPALAPPDRSTEAPIVR
jgi:hypothetical protein